ncbi:MAG: hypothetical protein GX136_06930 [Clostridiales bacterium]|jgi:hypothetical protein|nr:hypothetical protein [Clostridiales bacterium]
MIFEMSKLRQRGILTSFSLKCIALSCMLIDHTAYVLVRHQQIYIIMRIIGRISFPLFCFLIVEGYFHTRSLKRYLMRLFVFALVSEAPFDMALYNGIFNLKKQNVFFTLFVGLAMIALIDKTIDLFIRKNSSSAFGKKYLLTVIALILCICFVAAAAKAVSLLRTDYSVIGVLTILGYFLLRKIPPLAILSVYAVHIKLGGPYQVYSILSALPILLYNGKKGRSMRWPFYFFYPAHLLILYALRMMIRS